MCDFKGLVCNQNTAEASITKGFSDVQYLNFGMRYLDDRIKKKFSRYSTEDDRVIQMFLIYIS